MRPNRLRPSPSMAVALIALFVALGGVGYAAATIGSGDIKNNSIRSKDIRNKTITGKDVKNRSLVGKKIKANNVGGNAVKESSLGKVPTAGRADSAGAADAVDGASFRKFSFRSSANVAAPGTEVLSIGGLTLRATCTSIAFFDLLGVTASTTVGDADLYSEARDRNDGDGTTSGTDDNDTSNDDFASNEEVENAVNMSSSFGTGTGDTNNIQLVPDSVGNGTTHFRTPGGGTVVVHWAADDFISPCTFHGYAVAM